MPKTVVALYDDFETAGRAVEALVDAGFERKDISILANDPDKSEPTPIKTTTTDDGDVKPAQGAGFGAIVGGLVGLGVALIPGIGPVLAAGPLAAALFAGIGVVAGAATGSVVAGLVDLGIPEEDAQYYAEGIRRGGALVSVDVEDDAHVERAEGVLQRYQPVNINERGEFYRASGWKGFDTTAQPYVKTDTADTQANLPTISSTPTTINAGEQQKLNVVEEQVAVGKREVHDNTVRVHTRVTERPVEAQVSLHEEHVTVERNPVDRPASTADVDAFQEATIELKEKHEEPVVSKTARVVEEVVVGKQASDNMQTVKETVRRKDVVVEGAANASVATSGYDTYETRFRNDYTTNYAKTGKWEDYDPAYRFGYTLANDVRYKDTAWDRVESDARYQWEATHPNTWDKFKAAVRNAWDDVRGV